MKKELLPLFCIDIETVPCVYSFHELSPQWKELWITKNKKAIVEEGQDPAVLWLEKAGILAEFGKIVCISFGYFFSKNEALHFRIKTIYGEDEKALLKELDAHILSFLASKKTLTFCGHNIKEFDIPYLCRRMLINDIELPKYMPHYGSKPWENEMIDTLHWWRFGDFKHYTSLDLLASIFGIPSSKNDMDGSLVQHVFYQEKNLAKIGNYCSQDVVVVAQLMLRYLTLPLLSSQQIIQAD